MTHRIVLASASPRRLELCRQLDLDCVVWPVDIDETPQDSENATDFVSRMAMEKARIMNAEDSSNSSFSPV